MTYNRSIHLYFLDAKFQLLGICYSELHPEERTQWSPFKCVCVCVCVCARGGGGGGGGGGGLGAMIPITTSD